MVTIILIYLIATVIVFTLMHIYEIDRAELVHYIGKWGVYLFIITFFIPLLIHLAWIENWDCELNDINPKQ